MLKIENNTKKRMIEYLQWIKAMRRGSGQKLPTRIFKMEWVYLCKDTLLLTFSHFAMNHLSKICACKSSTESYGV